LIQDEEKHSYSAKLICDLLNHSITIDRVWPWRSLPPPSAF